MSPFRVIDGDYARLSSFASKLGPLNVPSRWNSSKVGCSEYLKNYGIAVLSNKCSSFVLNQFRDNEYTENSRLFHYGYSGPMASPEAITVDPNSYGCIKMSTDDLAMNSRSSIVSSLCINLGDESVMHDLLPEDDVNDDVSSSVVIEISPNLRDNSSEAVSVEEAIAWAKEKFQMQNSSELSTRECENSILLKSMQDEQIAWTRKEGKPR